MKIADLQQNQKANVVLLITAAEEKMTKKETAYCSISLCDGESQITANMWDTKKAMIEQYIGNLAVVNLAASVYNGQMSYTANYFLPAPKTEKITDYVKTVPFDTEFLYGEILKMIPECPLKRVVEKIYDENKEHLLYWSAAKSVHHNLYGGLLYHTYRMMKLGTETCKVYQGLNSEVLLSAIALHDIGKLRELDTDTLGSADYSVDGNLFGHLLIGHDMLRDAAKRFRSVKEEDLKLLDHCIVSHHGKYEYGAIKVPTIPEAFVLHYLDQIDANIYQFEEIYKDMDGGAMSAPKPTLNNARLYKPAQ